MDVVSNRKQEKLMCVICYCELIGNADTYLFLIDLASHGDDDFVDRPPTLRFDGQSFDSYAYCVLDWKLYMFESCLISDGCDIAHRTSVFVLDLSMIDPSNTFDLRLRKPDLNPGPCMRYAKRNPMATPTPDGRGILVFSSQLNCEYRDENGARGFYENDDFELYVPGDGSWIQLPRVPLQWGDSFFVKSFTFVGKSRFLLNTTHVGWLALDLESLDRGWQRGGVGVRCNDFDNGRFFVTEDGLALTPWGVYDNDVPDENGRVPKLSRFHWSLFDVDIRSLRNFRPMTLIDDVYNGKFDFCIMQTATIGRREIPQLIVDVFSCDLAKYREDKKRDKGSARIEARVTKSFKIRLASQRCTFVTPVNLFYLGPRAD